MKAEDLELIVKLVVAEFNKEFFYNSDEAEDQDVILENLNKSEKYVSFAINRFMEHFNSIAERLSAVDNVGTETAEG